MLILGTFICIFIVLALTIHIEFLIGAGVLTAILILINCVYRYCQIEDLTNIKALGSKKIIYQKMADTQLAEFKNYLGEVYPNIEKEIFNSLSPENVTAYAIRYPEIKSNETIMELVKLINQKITQVYNCDIRTAEIEARIIRRLLDSTIWVIPGLLLKNLPKE